MKQLTPAGFSAAAVAATTGLLLSLSCSMGGDPSLLYQRGVEETSAQHWETGIADLQAFAHKACEGGRPDKRCREADMALGHAYEHRGSLTRAWVAFDAALALPPHAGDGAARDDLARVEQLLRDRRGDGAGHGPVMVRYRDEMTDDFTARSIVVSIDFNPVHARGKGAAADLRSPDFIQLWTGSLPAGDHVLVVEAAHSCKPGTGARCAGSQVHRSWSFTSEAHTPTGLDVRAFGESESGAGNDTVRPALDMHPH